jgi:hypothetical protein
MPRTTLARLAALLPLVAGCAHHVYSPPARMLPLESVATLSRGETGVQGELGGVSWIDGTTASIRARRGFTERTEVSAEASVLHVGRRSAADTNRDGYALRAGGKFAASPWLALAGGLGGGASAAGGYFSPDVAVIVAWENRYVVPFLSGRASLSLPVKARQVDVTGVDDTTTFVGTPGRTWIFGATTGVRVPLGSSGPRSGGMRGNLLAGVGMTHLQDATDDQNALQLGFGGELVF